MGFTIVLLIGLVLLVLKKIQNRLFNSQVERDNTVLKHHLVSNVNLDYHGQGVINKLEKTIVFVSNPLRGLKESDYQSLALINKSVQKQEEED